MNIKDLLKDALPFISSFAPSIAGAIGGPVGLAAGYVLPVLADAFNIHPSNIAGLATKIVNDPDAQKKLEQIENDYGDIVNSLTNSFNHLASAEINIKLNWQTDNKVVQ